MTTFGRKINYLPLFLNLLISVIVSGLMLIVFKQVGVSVFFGVLCLIIVTALCSTNLVRSFGYWKITATGIDYYDYSTNGKRLLAILMPFSQTQEQVDFDKIISMSLVIGRAFQVPEIVKAAPASAYIVQTYETKYATPYYLELELEDGHKIDLDLSLNTNDNEKLEQAIKYLNANTKTKVKIFKN